MEKYKKVMYFRGKLYKDSLYNRILAKILTVSYLIKHTLLSIAIPLSFCLLIMGCVRSSAKIDEHFYTDTLFTDSFGCNGHSYIRFRVPHSTNFQLVHNPDCFCRFNRTFIVIKKNK